MADGSEKRAVLLPSYFSLLPFSAGGGNLPLDGGGAVTREPSQIHDRLLELVVGEERRVSERRGTNLLGDPVDLRLEIPAVDRNHRAFEQRVQIQLEQVGLTKGAQHQTVSPVVRTVVDVPEDRV